MNLSFGEKIKDARKSKNLTQKQLAEKIGAKHNSVSDWENDKNRPDAATIEILCKVLNITPNYLLDTSPGEYTPAEKNLIEKYRFISEYSPEGAATVGYILNREYQIAQDRKMQIFSMPSLPAEDLAAIGQALQKLELRKAK
ncbi:MAG: helix-turn-helix transcriptional regulator [Dorea sp.]|jgi:transcriptional regulator with XRE-family HTH domain|nr:helix-turn-helix transcriptional regulator [Dorea sp.]